jgi:hypothetical protein
MQAANSGFHHCHRDDAGITFRRVQWPPAEHSMETFKLLFTTDYGLLSLGVILFIIVMGFYLSGKLKKLMNQQPGKEGWD